MVEEIKIEAMPGTNFARVVALPVASGMVVSSGQAIIEVENHKVVQEIASPAAGIFVHALEPGMLVRMNTAIGFVADKDDDLSKLVANASMGIAPAGTSWDDLVCPMPGVDESKAGQPVSFAKSTEIAVLGAGAGQSLLATLGATLGQVNRSVGTPGFFEDKILDLVVYEASRLLVDKRFKVLNSRFVNGRIVPHEHINAGVSFDEGGRLTLYAISDSDRLDLPQTQDALVDGLMRYVGRRLSLADVASATFTISDVTATDLTLSVPLLPRDQCIIVVVIRDAVRGFTISISYDHRITEGLVVSNFAAELIRRVRSYSIATDPVVVDGALAAVCSFCERSAEAEVNVFRRRGLVRTIDAAGNDALCCSTCWEGW